MRYPDTRINKNYFDHVARMSTIYVLAMSNKEEGNNYFKFDVFVLVQNRFSRPP